MCLFFLIFIYVYVLLYFLHFTYKYDNCELQVCVLCWQARGQYPRTMYLHAGGTQRSIMCSQCVVCLYCVYTAEWHWLSPTTRFPPSFSAQPRTRLAYKLGDLVTLDCRADAYPPAEWDDITHSSLSLIRPCNRRSSLILAAPPPPLSSISHVSDVMAPHRLTKSRAKLPVMLSFYLLFPISATCAVYSVCVPVSLHSLSHCVFRLLYVLLIFCTMHFLLFNSVLVNVLDVAMLLSLMASYV